VANTGAMYTTGWEHGYLNNAGGGICSCSVHTNISVQTNTVRSGTYALQINQTAGEYFSRGMAIVPRPIVAVHVRLAAVPNADVTVVYMNQNAGLSRRQGIGIRGATGKWACWIRLGTGAIVWGNDGPSVVTGQWLRIDMVLRSSGSGPYTYTTDAKIDGVDVPQASVVNATSYPNFGNIYLGNPGTAIGMGTATYTIYFDDLGVWEESTNSIRTYPVGSGVVYALVPNGEGTSVNPSNFRDDNLNSPPVSPATRLGEIPVSGTADYVDQITADGTAYIELTMTDLAEGTAIALYVFGGESSADGTTGSFNRSLKLVDVNNNNTVYSIFGGAASAAAIRWSGSGISGVPRGAGSGSIAPDWSTADVNAVKLRIGYSTDVVPNPRFHNLIIEVYVVPSVSFEAWQMLN